MSDSSVLPADLLRGARFRACLTFTMMSLGIPAASWGLVLDHVPDPIVRMSLVALVAVGSLRFAFSVVSKEYLEICEEIRARLATEEGHADECARQLSKQAPQACAPHRPSRL